MTIDSSVYGAFITVFDEQLSEKWENIGKKIKNISPKYEIVAICHNDKKKNYHFVFRCTNNKDRIKVKTLLNLIGVRFREGIDDNLITHGGLENLGSFNERVKYLLHTSSNAKKEGKRKYSKTDLITNMPQKEIDAILSGSADKSKNQIMEDTINSAYRAGLSHKDWTTWYDEQNFSGLKKREYSEYYSAYWRGIDNLIEKHNPINRLRVHISADKDDIETIKKTIYLIYDDGKIADKCDLITPGVDVFVSSDYREFFKYKEIHENYPIYLGSKNKHNAWIGSLIVLIDTSSNVSIFDKFFNCEISEDLKLICSAEDADKSGSMEDQVYRIKMYKDFRDSFNQNYPIAKKKYEENDIKVDYSNLNE